MNNQATIKIEVPKANKDRLAMFLNDLAEGYKTETRQKPGTKSCLTFNWKGQAITVNSTSDAVKKFQAGEYTIQLTRVSNMEDDTIVDIPDVRAAITGNGVKITGALLAIKGEVMRLTSGKRVTLPFTTFVVADDDGAEDGEEAQNS